jgi:hypothetical protein
MRSTNWKDTAELIGIAAIVASLIFVGLQMQQDRDMTRLQVLAEQDGTQIEWARLINENAELWAKGLDGAELDKLDTLRFDSLTNALFSKRSYLYQRTVIGGRRPASHIAIRSAETIASFPGLEAAWARRWSRFQQQDVSPPYDVAVQGYLLEIRQGNRKNIDPGTYAIN